MIGRVLAAGPRGRLLSALFLVLATAFAVAALPRLTVDRSDDRLLDTDSPEWRALERLEAAFGSEQTVLVYLRSDDLFTEARLKALQDLGFALEDLPAVTKVDSLLTATNIRDKGDFVDAGPLATIVPRDPAKLAELKDDALYSPLMRGNVLSADGRATALAVSYVADAANPRHELELHAAIEALLAPLRGPFTEVFQVGRPRLVHEIDRGMYQDLTRLLPAAFGVLVVVIVVFLRSLRILPIPVVTSALTILWTLGFMAAAGIPITLLTAMIPALIIVVGAVEDVHMIASYCEGLPDAGEGRRADGIAHMAQHLALPLVITALTTIIGFISNVITEIPLIYEFALASGFAMLANFVVTVLAVPLLLDWLGPRRNHLTPGEGPPRGPIGAVVRAIEALGARGSRVVIAATLALVAWCGHGALDIEVNNDPLSYFSAANPFVRDAATVERDLAGVHSFNVVLTAGTDDFFRGSDGLERLARAEAVLADAGLFDRVASLAGIIALMNQEFHAGAPEHYKVPRSQEDLDLYLSTLTDADLRPWVTADFRTARITVRHAVTDSVRLNTTVDHLQKLLPGVVGKGVEVTFTGKNLMVNRTAESLIDGQAASLALLLAVVFLIFSLLYTSWLAGLLALVPNVVPLVLNFGTMGLLGVPLNPGTAMVAAIAIGIGVDDTIHLMTRFGAESRARVDESEAVRATIRAEAVPVISSSAALAFGFATLGQSSFNVIAQFGLLAAATMVYAALAELILTPILLKHLRLATVWDIIALELDRDVLVRCPLFRGMSPYAVRKLVVLSDIQHYDAGTTLIQQGSVSRGMFVILRGQADIVIERDGQTLTVASVGPGELVGEVGFSGSGVERTASVLATTPLVVVRFDADSTRQGLRFYPRIATQLHRNISLVLGRRLQESHQRLLSAVGGKSG